MCVVACVGFVWGVQARKYWEGGLWFRKDVKVFWERQFCELRFFLFFLFNSLRLYMGDLLVSIPLPARAPRRW